MATDIKISQMPLADQLKGEELIPIVQSSSNKTTTVAKIKEGLATTEQLGNKVDKDGSKVLSEKNFTAAYETKLKGVAENANNYTHPSGAGNNHIPSGGSSGQILVWASDGTAKWGSDMDTKYAAATSDTLGLVKQGVAVVDATSADDVITVVNALLESLRASGAIAPNAAAAALYRSAPVTNTSSEIIDFKPPMMIEKGKQYKEDGVIYECIQSSKLPISNKLKDLLGFYVKIIK